MIKYVLWTGGWDSTYLMLKMAVAAEAGSDIQIVPVYVTGDNRKSESIEIETMKHMLPLLREVGKARIDDVLLVGKDTIGQDEDITQAYHEIRGIVRIGTQYEYLARLTKSYYPLEIGIEKSNGEYSGCVTAIEKTGGLIEKDGPYYIDPD